MHASLADILTDLVQNSVEAKAARVDVVLEECGGAVRFSVTDNGCGMDAGTLKRAVDPFWSDGIKHPGRRVGLGIPFLRQTADQCGGTVNVNSGPGRGTRVDAVFPAGHLDLPPVGDAVTLWLQCLSFDADYEMNIRRVRQDSDGRTCSYEIERSEVARALGGLKDTGALGLLREYITSLEESLNEQGDSADGKDDSGQPQKAP